MTFGGVYATIKEVYQLCSKGWGIMRNDKENIGLFVKSALFSASLLLSTDKWGLTAYFICNLLAASLNIANVYLMKVVMDILSGGGGGWQELSIVIFSYAGIFVLLYFVNALSQMLCTSIKEKAFMKFDVTILEKMKHTPIAFLDSSSGRDFLMYARCANENAVYMFFNILSIATSLYTFLIAISIIARFSLLFAFILTLMVIPGIILRYIVKKKRYQYQFESAYSNRKSSYYHAMLTDEWAAKDMRIYNLSSSIKQRYEDERKNYETGIKKLDINRLVYSVLSVLVEQSGVVLFTMYLIYMAFLSRITVGDVGMYIGYSLSMSASFAAMVSTITSGFQDAQLVMKSYFELIEMKCNGEETNIAKRKLETFESLEFVDVCFKYPNTDNYILQNTSFGIHKGDRVSIVGINGAGKSTIIKLILGLYEIESGEIRINGNKMNEYDITDVRKMFSVLFQNFVKYPLTFRENIGLSDYREMENDKKIFHCIEQGGITEDILSKLRQGIDSTMTREFDDDGVALSKGQWQKIAIARTYFKNADVIVFDEPSAALDAEAEDRVFESFCDITKNKTGIMISHRISSSKIATKVIVLDGGKIVEEGTHEALLESGGLYAKLYNLQKSKYTMEA